jgi:hypothetical protein
LIVRQGRSSKTCQLPLSSKLMATPRLLSASVKARLVNSLGAAATVVQVSTVMPWGNRSLLLRDLDESLVNVFSRPQPAAQTTER